MKTPAAMLESFKVLRVGYAEPVGPAPRRRRIGVFGGLDLQSDAGWDALKGSIAELARTLFPPAR